MTTSSPSTAARSAERAYVWPLSIPRNVRAELRIIGDDLRTSDIERLRKQVDLLMDALSEEEEDA